MAEEDSEEKEEERQAGGGRPGQGKMKEEQMAKGVGWNGYKLKMELILAEM